MAEKLDEMIVRLLGVYTQEELKDLLGVSLKSIDNYKNGANPNKKTKAEVLNLYKKVSENNWQRLQISNKSAGPATNTVSAAGIVLKRLTGSSSPVNRKRNLKY